MQKEKLKFINNEILTLTIIGGLGRGHSVYKKAVRERDKNDLKSFLRKELSNYGKSYKVRIQERQHVENIKRFAQIITNKYHRILKDNKFRIGRAQKLLNLYLKYLWVLNWIPEPPHCPLDDKIISKLDLNIKWTKLDSIKDYKMLIEKARQVARDSGLSIAEWELRTWSQK